jgi:hypothetical protein
MKNYIEPQYEIEMFNIKCEITTTSDTPKDSDWLIDEENSIIQGSSF